MNDFSRINELKKIECIRNNVKITDLSLKDENGIMYFIYIIDNNIEIQDSRIIKYITNNYNMLKYAAQRGYFFKRYYNIDLLFQNNGVILIELMFKKEPNKICLLSLDIINKLFINYSGIYLIERFLNYNLSACKELINKVNDFDTLYDCFTKINRLDLMKYADENYLLNITPNGVSMMQELINKGIDISDIKIRKNKDICKILYENKKYDMVLNFDCKILLNYPNPSNNYINLLIKKYKEGEYIPFNRSQFFSSDNKYEALLYILLLRNNIKFPAFNSHSEMYDFVSYDLTNLFDYKFKPVIIYMLEMDKELIIPYFQKSSKLRKKLIQYISDFNEISVDLLKNIDLNDIFKYLPNKETLLEKLVNNNEIIEKDIYVDNFLDPIGEMTLLEYALKNNIDISDFEYILGGNLEAIPILIKYNRDKSVIENNISEKLLYEDIEENKKLIDFLIEKKRFSIIKSISKKDLRIMDYCVKYNCFSIINDNIFEELLVERNGKFLAEKYLSNDKFTLSLAEYIVDDYKLFKLYKKGYKKALINSNEAILLTEYNGITILEDLLKSGIKPTFSRCNIVNLKTMQILYSYGVPEAMCKAKLRLLMNYPNKNFNYMRYLINNYKAGLDIHFEYISYIDNDRELMARAYIEMTKNNLLRFLDKLTENILIEKDENGKSLLYYLINIDKELTLNEILSLNLKCSPLVFTELKLLGVSNAVINIEYDKFNCDNIFRQLNNEKYSEGIISPVEDLLEELKNLFYNDGKSDKELIDALITSYRYTTSVNPIFIEELKKLIFIKKEVPTFYYIKQAKNNFSSSNSYISSQSPTISTLNHETGHALHYFFTKNEVPIEYDDVIDSIVSDPNFIEKVENYSIRYYQILNNVINLSREIVSRHISDEKVYANNISINKLLSMAKEEIKQKCKGRGYTEETLDIIFSDSFTLEEFIMQKRDIEIGEMLEMILRSDYDAFLAIGDILDAITKGKFRDGLLKNKSNEKIKPTSGHGVRYYMYAERCFNEIIANYCLIIKSKQSNETLKYLRYLVGDELVDLLEEFYNLKIIKARNSDKHLYK